MKLFKKSHTNINITTETIVKGIILTVLAYIALQFIGSVTHQLRLILVAAFLAMALNPAVTWLTKKLKSGSRIRATAVAYVTVIVVLISFIGLVIPPLVKQTSEFLQDVPDIISDFKTQDSPLARTVRRYNLDEQLDEFSKDFNNRIGDNAVAPVFSTANRVLGTLVSIVTVLVLTFMMLIEGPLWFDRIMTLQAEENRERRKRLLQRMYHVVTAFVNAQVLIAAIGAVFALVAILISGAIFNVSVNAVALAGIIFMFALIPLIGSTIGATIVVLFTLLLSAPMALTLAIYFLIYQQIENATLQPYVQSRGNQLTPLVVFVAALLGAGLGGLLGALAAIPIAGCIRVLLEERYPELLPTQKTVDNPAETD